LYYNGIKLEFDHKNLDFYDIKGGSTILLRDLGYMVPLRLSKLIVSVGPPVIFSLFQEYHLNIYLYIEGAEKAL
jgi:very-long-chain enoyl-CoA reductase